MGRLMALGSHGMLFKVAMSQQSSDCSGKRLGESCQVDAGHLAVTAQQRGVCASIGNEMLCLACGRYASVDLSEELGDALGRLGTWGVFAVGATVGSVAMSGLLAVAWQLRRKFEAPFEDMARTERSSEKSLVPRRRPPALRRPRPEQVPKNQTFEQSNNRIPPAMAKAPKAVQPARGTTRSASGSRDVPSVSGWRRRLEERSLEPTRFGLSQDTKWSELEAQLDQDLKDEGPSPRWIPSSVASAMERRGHGHTAPTPSRCPPRPAK